MRCVINKKAKLFLILAALLALFLGALDALVVGAAMPTIVSDLGGLPLYSWVFSAYFLARAVSLPIFGKLCDLLNRKSLYLVAIVLFVASSAMAGLSRSMGHLIICRALQGIGAGGTFALAYIVLSDLYPVEERGKMMGIISLVWGVSSILGPPVGGFIVAWFSWQWIFYMNLPLGLLALLGVALYLHDKREKKQDISIDFWGALTLTIAVTALLAAFLMGGREYPWFSFEIEALFALFFITGALFVQAERKAKDPILPLEFFWRRQFSMANGSAFFGCFAIFSLSAFAPLFLQGVLGKGPAELGLAMVPLTLGWSLGAMVCGNLVTSTLEKSFSVWGAVLMAAAVGLILAFGRPGIPVFLFAGFLGLSGIGMGFVSVPTLLLVQKSLSAEDLGVATSSQQFARTLGGTIGIGISGGLVATSMEKSLGLLFNSPLKGEIPLSFAEHSSANIEALFHPDIQSRLEPLAREALRSAIGGSVRIVFWIGLGAALASLFLCLLLPSSRSVADGKPGN